MIAKGNVKTGIEWRCCADWQGQTYGAKNRKGALCQRPENKKNGRCRLHVGLTMMIKYSLDCLNTDLCNDTYSISLKVYSNLNIIP